ncbi:MAG: DUF4830 domain-containing protein [Ruminococcaceae bacterium]|nr:DUF4830 domain-containing protein [Oscillospiraceae bacterium]
MKHHPRRISCFGWCVIIMLTVIITLWSRIFLLEYVMPDRQDPHISPVTARYYNFSGGFTNRGRLDFIAQFGWEVDRAAVEKQTVRVPKQFTPVWEEYNTLQMRLGLDLRRYRGKRLTRHTYRLNNHPAEHEYARVNLYVHGNKIVAADVCSVRLNGFIHAICERN